MSKIFCKKYQIELDALNIAPVPGEKGQYIKDNYSAKAWSDWLDLQTMLINENQLDLSNKEAFRLYTSIVKNFRQVLMMLKICRL